MQEGDKPEASALVLEGMVARYHALASGKRQYLSFHLSGDLPDAQTLFLEKMDHTVCAVGKAAVALIAHKDMLGLFKQRPSIGFAIWRETLIDAAIFREAITNNSSRPPRTRMAHLFSELYYRARSADLEKAGSLHLPLHQGQLGDALGMSLVTVNRTLQALRRTSAMEFRNGDTHGPRLEAPDRDRRVRFRLSAPAGPCAPLRRPSNGSYVGFTTLIQFFARYVV